MAWFGKWLQRLLTTESSAPEIVKQERIDEHTFRVTYADGFHVDVGVFDEEDIPDTLSWDEAMEELGWKEEDTQE